MGGAGGTAPRPLEAATAGGTTIGSKAATGLVTGMGETAELSTGAGDAAGTTSTGGAGGIAPRPLEATTTGGTTTGEAGILGTV